MSHVLSIVNIRKYNKIINLSYANIFLLLRRQLNRGVLHPRYLEVNITLGIYFFSTFILIYRYFLQVSHIFCQK